MIGNIYMAGSSGLTVTDTGDFFVLIGAAGVVCEVLEVRVFQTSDTTLAMNGILFTRGTGGDTGNAVTEYERDPAGPGPVATCIDLPTGDVDTGINLLHRCGWNILQEFVWLPTPDFQIHLAQSAELGISLLNTDALTIGCSVTWREVV